MLPLLQRPFEQFPGAVLLAKPENLTAELEVPVGVGVGSDLSRARHAAQGVKTFIGPFSTFVLLDRLP
jgi:hypothetical protein